MSGPDEIQPYAFTDESPAAPPLPGEVTTAARVDTLLDKVASDLVAHAVGCVRRFGDFHLALSGETVLEPLYVRLMVDPNLRMLPWRRTHLWLAAGTGGGFGSIGDTIVAHADIPPDQVHPIAEDMSSAAGEYEVGFREAIAWRERGHDRLDYALLALGRGGEVAGLSAADDTLDDTTSLFRVAAAGAVTVTLAMLNATRLVAVVATGAATRKPVRMLAAGDADPKQCPAAGLTPRDGELKWYLDAEACGEQDET